MLKPQYNKTQVIKYLGLTFGLAYVIQIGAAYLYNNGNREIAQMVMAAMMFVPALGVLLSGAGLREIGWKPQIRKNVRNILIAWLSPAVLTFLGALLYFLIFPGHFDLSGDYLVASGGPELLQKLEEQGISYPTFVLVTAVACITYAPLLNMFVALGEEIGWRGFLYPQLKEKFGRKKGWLLGGAIWGAWHWPLIWLIGYEYGAATGNEAGYLGFPIVGMLLFCVITVGLGILHDYLYEKSESIWVPAIFHGAFNAAATIPFTVCLANTGSFRLLGPAPTGLLAAVPLLTIAAVLFFQREG
ncbi:MAG: CPBP family intramembrane metalloprotease [Lachnospiraceae bacterium]|nr:CPBP family intramembrane metalloprotease [Lachnospiraceae bacterium]